MGDSPTGLVPDAAQQLTASDLDAYAAFALRTRSPFAREVLRAGGHTDVLGRVLALGGADGSHTRGLAVLDDAVAAGGVGSLRPEALSVWTSLLLRAGREDQLREVLATPDLPLTDAERWVLRTDLANPHRTGAGLTGDALAAAERDWLAVLNEVHTPDGLEPVELVPPEGHDTVYQRLTTTLDAAVDGDLVSVVMSAYRPDADLRLAVRGVLQQTWRNLELIIVDDASGPGSDALLEEVAALDPRVRVVRAPRNAGTYAARNLALTVARGRWMTFQDSDDWTHPRRIEHQVRHLLDFPRVLANRTWTLRSYPDLTMTFVGYPARRLNASSLLLDIAQVTELVGDFDVTRKSGDMELPLRLRAVRPGSVRDLSHPSPLAITQLRVGSLSRDDAVPGWTRWDRLAYRDSYLEWHEQLATGRIAPGPGSTRPFPLPRHGWYADRDQRDPAVAWDVVVLGDIRPVAPDALRTLGVARTASASGLRTAIAHAEAPRPLSTKRLDLLPGVSTDVRLGRLGLTSAHEDDAVDLLVVTSPESVLHLDGAGLRPGSVLVVTDTAEPQGWTVAAVDSRCAELFGVTPTWGGPAAVHEPGSPVRAAVPADRWTDADLADVVGARWLEVPGHRRPSAADGIAIGHHLPDAREHWPEPATAIRAAHPGTVVLADRGEVPVEVHCLHGLGAVTKALGRRRPPPSWLSFAGTGMTPREFLSHIDAFVHLGVWGRAAEHATREALAAGLPCVVGTDAAPSGLTGRIRCVAPDEVGAALAELLAEPAAADAATAAREAAWTRTLHDLVATPTAPDPN